MVTDEFIMNLLTADSFRPLSGILVLNSMNCRMKHGKNSLFPSPVGDIGFKWTGWELHYSVMVLSFRPLSGILVLNFVMKKNVEIAMNEGFRPLSGILVLNQERKIEMKKNVNKFPSPVGDIGFKSVYEWTEKDKVTRVSVPCRGYWF